MPWGTRPHTAVRHLKYGARVPAIKRAAPASGPGAGGRARHSQRTSAAKEPASAARATPAVSPAIQGATGGSTQTRSATPCTAQAVWRRRLGGRGARSQAQGRPASTKP